MRPYQIRSSGISEQKSPTAECVAHPSPNIDHPENKILANICPRRESEIKMFTVQRRESSQKFNPEGRERVVFPPARIVLRPRNSHNDPFVDEPLVGEKRNTLGAGQKCDMGAWILNSQILQKTQFHYDVAELPVFDYKYALHFPGCADNRGT